MAEGGLESLLQRLQRWVGEHPDKVLFRYLGDSGRETDVLTYAEVEEQTRNLAHHLLARDDVKPGDRVLLVFLPSLHFILAFLACLRAGVVAVPVYPPDPRSLGKSIKAFSATQEACGATVALTNQRYSSMTSAGGLKALFTGQRVRWPDMTWVTIDKQLEAGPKGAPPAPLVEPPTSDTAFLQFTSGSTAAPKGVMISHGNLAHNLDTIVRSLEASTATQVVSWLPQYHDMGLIGSFLGIVYCGGSGAYFSPISFVKNPPMWVEAVSKYRATHLQSPNFGFKLCARKFVEKYGADGGPLKDTLDLSSVQHMFNAAEPITSSAIALFFKTFVPFKLNPASMKPGYGLAESTVYVVDGGTQLLRVDKRKLEVDKVLDVLQDLDLAEACTADTPPPLPDSDAAVAELVTCGNIFKNPDVHIAIVNDGVPAPDGTVGEIWLHSPSIAAGYYGLFELSAKSFHALLVPATEDADEAKPEDVDAQADGGEAKAEEEESKAERPPADRHYYRTGDFGVVHNNQLCVVGRIKDLIIVRGRNHYPQDIEETMAADGRLRPGCMAAFPVPVDDSGLPTRAATATGADDDEGLAVIAEVRDAKLPRGALEGIVADLRRQIQAEHGVSPVAVLLLKPRESRKTTSGKIARKHNRTAFLSRDGDKASPWHASTGAVVHEWLASSAAQAEGGPAPAAGAGTAASCTAPSAPAATPALPPGASGADLDDAALLEALRGEVARELEDDVAAIAVNRDLASLGLDSLRMNSLSGVLHFRYGLHPTQEQLFGEQTSLEWLVANRVPLSQQSVNDDGSVEAPTAAWVAVTVAARPTPAPGQEHMENPAPPVRRGPSKCQQYCPCCVCCY